jgi:hypothetical protein
MRAVNPDDNSRHRAHLLIEKSLPLMTLAPLRAMR